MKLRIIAICIFLVGAPSVSAQANTASDEEILARRAGPITDNKLSMIDNMVLGFSHAEVPAGIVRIVNCNRSDPQVRVNTDLSVKALLDLLKLKIPDYNWRIDGGVIDLFPNTSFPVPLDIRIPQFKVEDVTALEAMNQLVNRSDLKEALASRGLFQGLELGGGGFPISKNHINLNLKDVTLLEVLNSIVRADGRAVWGYTLSPCQGWNQYQLKLLVN